MSAPEAAKYFDELAANAKRICAPGKGILAADESLGTIKKRFDPIGVECTEENRRKYRELLFTAPGVEEYLGGVIFFEDSLYQKAADGRELREVVASRGIVVGVKVDKGLVKMDGFNGETATQGLDKLGERCAKFYAEGVRFTKWRAALKIGAGMPSEAAVSENAGSLARYAAISQQNGLVPIVEPEILMDGDHDIKVAADTSRRVVGAMIDELHRHKVFLEGCVIKTNMVCPGASHTANTYTAHDIAVATVQSLQRAVPPAMPGIVFLSGGLSEEDASTYLSAINAVDTVKPWQLSFSYGRALQASVLKAWGGKDENIAAAQAALLERCKANGDARYGKYVSGSVSGAAANDSSFVANYTY